MPKLTKTQRSANAKKAWRKRKKGGLSKGTHTLARRGSTAPRKRVYRKPSRRRSGLAELVGNLEAKQAARHMGNGALGGGAAFVMDRLLPKKMRPRMKLLWTALVGFGIATVGRAPVVGASMVGVATYKALSEIGLLGENNNNYADPLEQLPMVLDSSGQSMVLSDDETGGLYLDENGNQMYLDENGDPMYLDESDYQVAYAPDFGSGAGWE